MKRLEILNRPPAERGINPGEDHIIISVSDPELGFPKIPHNGHLREVLFLSFHDTDKEMAGYEACQPKHAQQIAEFIQKHKGIDLIYCQCDAGICRSAGIAAAIAKHYNNDDQYYFDAYFPNMRVYRMVLEALHNDGC